MGASRNVVILGSTGSVGVNTLDVITRHKDRFRVVALTAHRQVDLLFEQCIKFRPQYAVIGSENDAERLSAQLRAADCATEVGC